MERLEKVNSSNQFGKKNTVIPKFFASLSQLYFHFIKWSPYRLYQHCQHMIINIMKIILEKKKTENKRQSCHAHLQNNSSKSNPFYNFPVLFQKVIYQIKISSAVCWNFLQMNSKINR